MDYPTGTVPVTLDDNGVPTYEIKEGVAWDYVPFTDEMEALARTCDAVCFGSLAQRNGQTKDTIRRFLDATPEGCLKVFDINLRQQYYDKSVVEESMRRCDILKINEEEIDVIFRLLDVEICDVGDRCHYLIDRYDLQMLVLTCGENGSYAFSKTEESFLPTPKIVVADTVGAGDSFTGSFVAALLNGKSMNEAHQQAVEVSAYVCTQHGAMPTLPTELIEKAKG